MQKVLDEIALRTLDTVTCVPSTGDCPPTRERQCFVNCHIQGDVDFIFGPYRCWFERCTLYMNQRGGWYTAANTPEAQPWGLVFHRCRLTGECDTGAASLVGPSALGRTLFWCDMDEHVNPAGFEDWQNWDGVRPVTRRCGEWGHHRREGRYLHPPPGPGAPDRRGGRYGDAGRGAGRLAAR